MTRIEIAEKLKQARIACGLTQKAVADAIGKSPKLVGHWETGYSRPDADTLSMLLRLYSVDANAFFDIAPSPTNEQRTEDERRLIAYYKKASSYDQHAILRFAEYVTQSAIVPSKEVIEEEARLAAQSLIRQSRSQLEIPEVAK